MSILKNILELAKIKKPKHKRSSKWPKVREEHLKLNPTCAVCGGIDSVEVHHIIPFSVNPELELDKNNLVTLCESASHGIICHMCIGHNGNYKDNNTNVLKDAEYIREMLKRKEVNS